MKRLILLLTIITLSIPVLAQQTSNLFEQLTDKYADKDGFSASKISSDMFDLYLKKKNIDEESPVSDALKKLDNILVVSQSNINGNYFKNGNSVKSEPKANEPSALHSEILEYYKRNSYSLFKTEKRMGEDVKVYLKKEQNNIKSLALITNSSVSTNLVELQGNIDLKTVSKLNEALNLRGLENLYKIDNSSSSLYGYSTGSRAYFSDERIEEMVARERKMAEQHAELTEVQQAQIEEQAKQMVEKQMQMAEKYREMAEKYQRQPIFLSYPGDTNTVYYLDGKKVKADKIKELDKENIESIEVKKAENEKDKTTIKIKTK